MLRRMVLALETLPRGTDTSRVRRAVSDNLPNLMPASLALRDHDLPAFGWLMRTTSSGRGRSAIGWIPLLDGGLDTLAPPRSYQWISAPQLRLTGVDPVEKPVIKT